MWTRLSETDIARANEDQARRERRLWPPLLTGVLFAAAVTVALSFGYRGGRASSGVVLLGPSRRLLEPAMLLVFAVVLAFMFTIAYRKQRRTGGGLLSESPSVICQRCHAIVQQGASDACTCGGTWEPIHHWEWNDSPQREGA